MEKPPVHFVYVSGLKGPEPEIWLDVWQDRVRRNKSIPRPLQTMVLPEIDYGLTLKQLAEKYPYKPVEESHGKMESIPSQLCPPELLPDKR
jgi:hypothetical protein